MAAPAVAPAAAVFPVLRKRKDQKGTGFVLKLQKLLSLTRQAVERYEMIREGDRIAVGVDAKDGLVRTDGWVKEEGIHYLDFAKSMESLGVKNLIFTDIDTDGTLTGPSFARLKFLLEGVSCSVTAAGGVSCNADIQALKRMGIEAVIVGKSWYAGALDLAQAIEEGGPQ